MNKTVQMAYDYLMGEGEIDLFAVLDYLNSQGVYPSCAEKDEIALMVDSILTELDLVRSLKLLWDTKRYNRLVYGL